MGKEMKVMGVWAAVSLLVYIGSSAAFENVFWYTPVSTLKGYFPWICVVNLNISSSTFAPQPSSNQVCSQSWGCGIWAGHDNYSYPCEAVAKLPYMTDFSRMISIPEDIKFSASDNFIVQDEICSGEDVSINIGNRTGEWWDAGGSMDSPPIQWIGDVVGLVKKLVQYHRETTDEKIIPISIPDEPFIDEFGITVYPQGYENKLNLTSSQIPTSGTGNLVCSLKQKSSSFFGAGSHNVDNNEVNIETDILCSYYVYGTNVSSLLDGVWKYNFVKVHVPAIIYTNGLVDQSFISPRVYTTADDFFRVHTIKFKKKLKIVEPTEAMLEIQSFAGPAEGNERLARFVIKNKGDGKASIDGIKIRGKEIRLTCDNKELGPGQSAECVAVLDRNERNLRLSYSEQPCGKPKHNALALSLKISDGEEEGNFCESSSDCSTGEECCVNLCRPAAEGVCDDIDSDGILDTWVPYS